MKKKNRLKKHNVIVKNTNSLWTTLQSIWEEYLNEWGSSGSSKSKFNYLKIFVDWENIYNMGYLFISIIAFAVHPLIYSLLLLDFVKRSEDLKNVIRAVTLNYKQLIKTLILGLIIIYLYSIIGFVNFRESFAVNNVKIANYLII